MRTILLAFISTALLLYSCVKDRTFPAPTITPSSGTLIHYWNFNGTSTTTPTYTIGGGNLAFDFTTVTDTTGYDDLLSPVVPTTNINAQNGDVAGNALRVRNPCLDFIIIAPTTGYKNIVLSYSVAKSNSGASTDSVYYTTDGTTYTNAGLSTVTYSPMVDPAYMLETFNFSSITAVNNNPNFKFKITFSNGNLATSGNDRFDNITVFGDNISGTGTGTGIPVISSATTATGTVGTPFTSYTITASNTPTGFSVSGLPAGLTVNATTGIISGTPTVAGTFIDTLKATNAQGTGVQVLTITISPVASIQLLHYWNFNNDADSISLITPTSTIGGGALSFDFANVTGTIGYYDSLVPSPTTLNARNGDSAGALLRIRNPSVDFIITAPTTGYKNIVLSYAVAASSTTSGALTDSVYYSTDGNTYVNTGLAAVSYSVNADPDYVIEAFDLSSIAAVNNNANFKFKVVFTNGNLNTKGNTRIDNLTVEGFHQ